MITWRVPPELRQQFPPSRNPLYSSRPIQHQTCKTVCSSNQLGNEIDWIGS